MTYIIIFNKSLNVLFTIKSLLNRNFIIIKHDYIMFIKYKFYNNYRWVYNN